MWSRLTQVHKKSQAEVFVNNLRGNSSKIEERIKANIGDKLVENKQGSDEMIEFFWHLSKRWEGPQSENVLSGFT